MGTEIPFEALSFKPQANFGTAEAAPTYYVPLTGTVINQKTEYYPERSSGMLARNTRSKATDFRSAFSASGDFDIDIGPLLGQLISNGTVTAPTTPAGATNARLWTFSRSMTAATLKFLTAWFGDPNPQMIYRAADTMLSEFSITGDATAEDGAVKCEMSGIGKWASLLTSITQPAQTAGSTMATSAMQLWLNAASSAIGTTDCTSLLTNQGVTFPTGATPKRTASGPATANPGWTRRGMGTSNPSSTISLEVDDATQYNLFANDSYVFARLRFNGAFIETITGPVDLYEYIEFDFYGKLTELAFADNAGVNRVHTYTIPAEYNATWGTDMIMRVQSTKTSI